MEKIVADFCDDVMLFNPEKYTEAGKVNFHLLATDFIIDFTHDWDDPNDILGFNLNNLRQEVMRSIKIWWDLYPSAFKYRA